MEPFTTRTSHYERLTMSGTGYILILGLYTHSRGGGAVRAPLSISFARRIATEKYRAADPPRVARLEEAPEIFRENTHLPGFFCLFFHPGILDLVTALMDGAAEPWALSHFDAASYTSSAIPPYKMYEAASG